MSKSESPKAEYGKGYADGIRHTEHEREHGLLGSLSDLVHDSRYDHEGSSTYKEGFKDGRRDGKK